MTNAHRRRIICNIILIAIYAMIVAAWAWHGSFNLFVFVLVITLGMLAFISWLYNEELERVLAQSKQAESLLEKRKAELEAEVEKRTAELKRAQIDEMRQMYRFTELGQFGVMLLHDLANQLTTLSLEVEDLQRRQQTQDIARIKQIIRYLEELMDSTRDRMHDGAQSEMFDVLQRTTEIVNFLRYKAAKAGVNIEWEPPRELWAYSGDPMCLGQVITIITNNAIDAYGDQSSTPSPRERRVLIEAERTKTEVILRISDWAGGLPASKQAQLFKPFTSSKQKGLGLGLFIAKQTIELNFQGKIEVKSRGDLVVFTVTIPRRDTPDVEPGGR